MTEIQFIAPGCGETLRENRAEGILTSDSGVVFPIIRGIPVLIGDCELRERIAFSNWHQESPDTLDAGTFYNRLDNQDAYCREQLSESRLLISNFLSQNQLSGHVLEIGSGKGPLQGIGGDDYVALDFSLTALERFIDVRYQRVCASAEQLPFSDESLRFIFSVATLEHVPNAAAVFSEIHRTLKPGGMLFLLPAWHCEQYNCEGIPVRNYNELSWRQCVTKFMLPLYRSPLYKAFRSVPWRAYRRALFFLRNKPTELKFDRLKPDYSRFWLSDSDAACRIDTHEAALFFSSRKYRILAPGASLLRQLLARHVPLVATKP